MPDQAPPAPEGCVYGPWLDEQSYSKLHEAFGGTKPEGTWCAINKWRVVVYSQQFQRWGKCNAGQVETRAITELLRLAKENAELRAKLAAMTVPLDERCGRCSRPNCRGC